VPDVICIAADACSDEIYANSVWGDDGPRFVSTEVLARRELAEGNIQGVKVRDGGDRSWATYAQMVLGLVLCSCLDPCATSIHPCIVVQRLLH
jgi:hypothetical protein